MNTGEERGNHAWEGLYGLHKMFEREALGIDTVCDGGHHHAILMDGHLLPRRGKR